MRFWSNVYQRGDKIFLRGFNNGERINREINYKPYLFVPAENGKYKTLEDQPADKLNFDSISDARDYVSRYSDIDNFHIYGLTNWPYVFIYDNYKGEVEYDIDLLRIVSLDIEVDSEDTWPNITEADKEITAITIRSKGKAISFGCGEFIPEENDIYVRCENEENLLRRFLEVWASDYPDIITGWNVENFDLVYLVHRINRILSEFYAKMLSPWNIINKREIEVYQKKVTVYTLAGISTLDYMQVYRKFSFTNQESYALNFIAQIVLGEKKVDYSEYGSLASLHKNNFQKFMAYNVVDTVLIDKLEERLGFISQIIALAYKAKVNYTDAFTSVLLWDIIIHNFLLDQNIVIPNRKRGHKTYANAGGYVKDPILGLHKWVLSGDLKSSYPHQIMQFNISPETLIGKLDNFLSVDEIVKEGTVLQYLLNGNDYSIAGNGCLFRRDKQGFLPALMEKFYNERVQYSNKEDRAKKEFEKNPSKHLENEISRNHNMQWAIKIILNACYGSLANIYCRWFDIDMAEAITLSGQLSIKWIEKAVNDYMNKVLKTQQPTDFIVSMDTDSIYVVMDQIVELIGSKDEDKLVKALDTFWKEKVQKVINISLDEFYTNMNAYKPKIAMARECIASKSIITGKKHYILNVLDEKGIRYNPPKLKIVGIEAVRSSTPMSCRNNIKKALNIIMNEDEKALQKFILEFKDQFLKFSFEDVAFPRSVQGLDEYSDSSQIYRKGSPIQVKGSLIYNEMLKKNKIVNIPPIQNGDKIKFCYLKMPNPVHDTVIAVPDFLPDEFGLEEYIDREKQFNKSFVEPLKSITEVIGWKTEHQNSLEDFL